jgi:hypothetical protein
MNFLKKIFDKKEQKKSVVAWQDKNEIESVREDGYVIYKTKRVTTEERKQIGFYGKKRFSENGNYCVV